MPSLVYRTALEMMCNVALERRLGFLNLDNDSQDMIKIMTALKGYQTASNQAMYGLPWWKYLPASLSGVLFLFFIFYSKVLSFFSSFRCIHPFS